MRKKIIAGNWKMNKTPNEALELVKLLKDKVNTSEKEVIFCPPYIDLLSVAQALKGTDIFVAAQNMYYEDKGAFTGEIAPDMLIEAGIKYTIIGHSERRTYFAETDETVNKKVIKAIEKGIVPIVCVGETLEQREDNIQIEFIRIQVKKAFKNVGGNDARKVIIAYEPIWAIGTGKTATSEQAEEICSEIRNVIKEIYDEHIADNIRILYGGSVNASNAKELFTMPNIDGGLVGGASLKEDFEKIVNYDK